MTCNACKLEMENLLSAIPSKWRDQIVAVICDHIVNQGIDCLQIMSCLSDEMTTLDFGCLAESQSEWDALSYLGKIQRMIDTICTALETVTFNILDSTSINLSGDGTGGDPLTAAAILKPTGSNILTATGTGLYVPPSTIVANGNCITFILSTDGNGTKTYTPTIDTECIAEDVELPTILANNGLHIEVDTVQLGGTLLDNTLINGDTFSLQLQYTDSNFLFTPTSRTFLTAEGDFVGIDYQTSEIILQTIANEDDQDLGDGFLSLGLVKAETDNATIGFMVPVEGSITPSLIPKDSSYLTASDYTLSGYGNEILFTSPYALLTTGALVTGKSYRITVSSGGANFVPSGAANNTVGTTFIANGVSPTWGTGSLELLGNITLANTSNANVRVSRSSIITTVDTDTAAPSDYRSVSLVQPGYCHIELTRDAVKNFDPPNGYLADSTMFLQTPSPTERTARIGVAVPSLVGTVGSAPAPTQLTCMTSWANTSGDATTNGLMVTYSPYVSFRGISGFNGNDTKVAINTLLPTNPLHINNTADVYPLRIENPKTPASAAAAGSIGEISWDTSYIYVCTATNTWKRTALTTW